MRQDSSRRLRCTRYVLTAFDAWKHGHMITSRQSSILHYFLTTTFVGAVTVPRFTHVWQLICDPCRTTNASRCTSVARNASTGVWTATLWRSSFCQKTNGTPKMTQRMRRQSRRSACLCGLINKLVTFSARFLRWNPFSFCDRFVVLVGLRLRISGENVRMILS